MTSPRLLLSILLLALAHPVHAAIGDVVFDVAVSPTMFRPFAVDPVSSRFVSANGSLVAYYGFDGQRIESIDMDPPSSNTFSRGMSLLGSQRIVGFGSFAGGSNVYTVWRREPDGSGGEVFRLESSADLSALGYITWFNSAPDGSFWFLVGGGTIVHLASDLSTVLTSRPVDYPFIGLPDSTNDDHAIALTVEADTGRPVLVAYGNHHTLDSWGNLVQTVTAYYLDPTDLSVLGRYYTATGSHYWFAAAGGVLYRLNRFDDAIRGFELSEAEAPRATVESDMTGVMWRHCQYVHDFPPFNDTAHFFLNIDWGGDPGAFKFNDMDYLLAAPEQISETSFRLPYTLNDNVLANHGLPEAPFPTAPLEIINAQGQSSGVVNVALDFQASYVEGLAAGANYHDSCYNYGFSRDAILGSGQVGKWTLAQRIPPTPLDMSIEFADWFPFIGGKTFGVQDFQLEMEAAMIGQGTDKATMSGGGSFQAGIGEIIFKAGLGATTELKPDELLYDKGLIAVLIGGVLKAEQPLLELVPAFAALAEVPFVGRVFKIITETAKAVAEISLTGEATAATTWPEGAGLQDFCVEGKLELVLGQKVGMVIELMDGLAELSIFGGGNNKISWATIPNQCPDWGFNEFIVQMFVNARYVLFGATAAFEQAASIKYPFPAAKAEPVVKEPVWSYTWPGNTRTDKAVPTPVLVNENPFAVLDRQTKGTGVEATRQTPVLSGIGQDAKPAAALAPDGTTLLVWAQERGDLPPTQATDIYYSYFNGSSFSAPAPIQTDTRADMEPVVAYHHSGKWVAAWLRVRDDNLPTTGDPQADALAQSRQLSPYFSVFDPATRSWTEPAEVASFSDPSTSYLPRIATGPQHEIALLWLVNEEGDITPYDVETRTLDSFLVIYWALFDGSGFGLTGPMRDQGGSPYLLAMDLTGSYDGEELLIGFNEPYGPHWQNSFFIYRSPRPTDSYTRFERPYESNGYSQGGGQKILARGDGTIAVAATTDNVIRVAAGETWNRLDETGTLYQDPTYPGSCFSGQCSGQHRDNFVFGESASGDLYAVVPEIRGGNPDYVLAVEDPNATPAAREGLFNGGAIVEKNMAVATAANGDLMMFYYQADLMEDTVTRDLGDGEGEQEFDRTRAPDSGHIMLARHQLNTDLGVRDVSLVAALPEAGQQVTVSVSVFNAGDRAIEDPTVSLYVQDLKPANKGSGEYLVADNVVAVDGWLAAGDQGEVSVVWTLPATSQFRAYAVVDPMNVVDEFDETDNQWPDPASFDVLFADGFE